MTECRLLSCRDWKCPARARAEARAMYTQGPTRAQGETTVTIDRVRRVKNGEQGGDDGKLDRPVTVDSDGSHSWTVQLWGPWQPC